MPSATLTMPSVTTRWPGRSPCNDLDPPADPRAGADRPAARAALAVDDEDEALVALADHRQLGHRQADARRVLDADVEHHAGPQQPVRIGQPRAHRHRARIGIDDRVDRVDDAVERPVGIGGGARLDRSGPARIAASIVSGTVKSSLIVLMSLIVAISVPWLAIAPTEMLRKLHPAREGRADHPVADLRLRPPAPGRARRRRRRPGCRNWSGWRSRDS